MGIKRYIIATVILLVVIAGYIFSLESGDYRLEIVDQAVVLPVALWIMLPALILFIVTLTHMFYYGFKNFLLNRSIQKDNENLITLIEKRLLGEKISLNFKSTKSKEIGNILSQIDLVINDTDFSTTNSKINEIAEYILNINAGKYVSSKNLKLSNDNILMQQNFKNRIDIDDNFALEIIKQPSSYTTDVVKYAFIKVVKTKSMTTIKKFLEGISLDTDMLKALIAKDCKDIGKFSLDNTTLLKLIKKIDITNKDLIQIAREYKKVMAPEQLMKLFDDLSTQNEKLTESYLYVLSEYEMIDNMREILVSSQKDEFAIYKAYLDLRDAGKHYSLDKFI